MCDKWTKNVHRLRRTLLLSDATASALVYFRGLQTFVSEGHISYYTTVRGRKSYVMCCNSGFTRNPVTAYELAYGQRQSSHMQQERHHRQPRQSGLLETILSKPEAGRNRENSPGHGLRRLCEDCRRIVSQDSVWSHLYFVPSQEVFCKCIIFSLLTKYLLNQWKSFAGEMVSQQGRRQRGGQWCPPPNLKSVPPHFIFGPLVVCIHPIQDF